MNKAERQKHAKTLRDFAKDYLAHGLREYRGEPDMVRMIRGDAADYRKIAALILAGKINEAGIRAQSMDTAPRENIPQEVWDFICQ